MSAYFVAGTDTDIGKTLVASALLQHFNRQGRSTIGFKPIAAGCENTAKGLRNQDALSLLQHSNIGPNGVSGGLAPAYNDINPFAFEPPIAPHIAAKLVGQTITTAALAQAYQPIKAFNCDITIVEGAGGWCLPINDNEFLYQWVNDEQFEVILVVGIKLGCLNHALLTQAFIQSQGLTLVGWVANKVCPQMANIDENIATLEQHLNAPLLATIPWLEDHQRDGLVVDFAI
ncbi:MAG: dethiobiotin synthetase [Phenylobacterium sp.]|jgi:dethiobiotin synthetase